MRTLVYRVAARRDLNRIAHQLAVGSGSGSGSEAIGQRFVDRLIRRCERLAALGGTLGTVHEEFGPGLRTVSVGRYVILLRYTSDWLEIVRVVHAHRDITKVLARGRAR